VELVGRTSLLTDVGVPRILGASSEDPAMTDGMENH